METNQPTTATRNPGTQTAFCTCNQEQEVSIWEKDIEILAPLLMISDEEGVIPALRCLAEAVSLGLQRLEKEIATSEVCRTLEVEKVDFQVPRIVAELQHIAGFTPNMVSNDGDSFQIQIDIPGIDQDEDEDFYDDDEDDSFEDGEDLL